VAERGAANMRVVVSGEFLGFEKCSRVENTYGPSECVSDDGPDIR